MEAGNGWLMELDAIDGSRPDVVPFDIDGDGKFTTTDKISDGSTLVNVSGQQSNVGLIGAPGIISTLSKEYKYLPGSSGGIGKLDENAETASEGRQSWKQLK